jgi:hypothetical protein
MVVPWRVLRALDLAAKEREGARDLGEKSARLVQASERVLPEADGVVAVYFLSELRLDREGAVAGEHSQDRDERPVLQHVVRLGGACRRGRESGFHARDIGLRRCVKYPQKGGEVEPGRERYKSGVHNQTKEKPHDTHS